MGSLKAITISAIVACMILVLTGTIYTDFSDEYNITTSADFSEFSDSAQNLTNRMGLVKNASFGSVPTTNEPSLQTASFTLTSVMNAMQLLLEIPTFIGTMIGGIIGIIPFSGLATPYTFMLMIIAIACLFALINAFLGRDA